MDNNGRELYFEAVKLAEEGNHETALAKLQVYLQDRPTDGEALNDAGTILFCLHRGKEAIDYFLRARNFCEGEKKAQVYWNLCEACIEEKRPDLALELLDQMERAQVLNLDILNRLATLFVDREDCGTAIDLLLRSLGMASGQELLPPMLEVIRSRRAGLTVAGAPVEMSSDLVEFFRVRYPGTVCRGGGLHEIQSAAGQGGILLYLGVDTVLRDLTRGVKTAKLIVRLRCQDMYHPVLREVDWSRVDALIVPDEKSRVGLLEWLDVIPAGLQVAAVGPGLETETMVFVPKARGKRVAAIGPWDAASNPMFLLQCVQKMHYVDADMRFHLAGEFTDPVVENYVLDMIERLELDNCVILDGRPRNWSRWLRDKHYIMSTALDARGMAGVYRGMAAGLKPVVHAFAGAEEYLGREHLFLIAEQFCEQITGGEYEPESYRAFAVGRCSRLQELRGLDQVVRMVEKTIIRRAAAAVPAAPIAPAAVKPAFNSQTPTTFNVPAYEPPVRPSADSLLQNHPAPTPVTWNSAPAAPVNPATPTTRSIEEIAMEALNTARRLSGNPDGGTGFGQGQGGLTDPF